MRLFQIDAFADAAFKGNPAGVCLLDERKVDEAWMQNVAAEMNVAETAFVRRNRNDWALRWFTPTVEAPLCGHATLATAHAMLEEGLLSRGGTARFQTLSGELTATHSGDLIEMDFPSKLAEPAAPPDGLIEALGMQPVRVSRNDLD